MTSSDYSKIMAVGRFMVGRQPPPQHPSNRPLVGRVDVAVQQADRDGVDVRPPEPLRRPVHPAGLQRTEHTVRPHPLLDFLGEHRQRRRMPGARAVELRTRLAPQRQQVAKAACRHEPRARAPALE